MSSTLSWFEPFFQLLGWNTLNYDLVVGLNLYPEQVVSHLKDFTKKEVKKKDSSKSKGAEELPGV